jgi:hypothetical protein
LSYIRRETCIFKHATHIGISRQQLQISSLEDKITLDNPVRFIEAFVEHILLELLGFTTRIAGETIAIDGTKSWVHSVSFWRSRLLDYQSFIFFPL